MHSLIKYLSIILVVITISASVSALLPAHSASQAILLQASTSNLHGKALVLRGPSPIMDAEGTSPQDLTLINEYLAVTIAVGSSPPWGVPQGNLIDAAVVINDTPQRDFLAQFSSPVNGWGVVTLICSFLCRIMSSYASECDEVC